MKIFVGEKNMTNNPKIVQSSSPTRIELGSRLPLNTPLSVHMFTSYCCEFKCVYCAHSLQNDKFQEIFGDKKYMSFNLFMKAINGIKKFSEQLKMISFDGWGEPLLNPALPAMLEYAKRAEVAERLELVTNGYSLTNEKADAITNAGLDRIRISIQGLNAGKYKEVSNINIDYNKFLNQIKYLYQHKKQLSIYIKIIDVALDNEKEQVFYDMFGDYCDHIAVEHMVPTAEKVDYSKYKEEYKVGQQGYKAERISACPFPFYMLVVEPDGEVRPCCATRHPIALGNINKEDLYTIWNSEKLFNFWQDNLSKGGRFSNAVCCECTNPDYGVQPGDKIDLYKDVIKERMRGIY